ncbi:MAG: hypothetical protein UV73_C0005G0053 [Candidatus Gottesmanbacteria bacterium GW2011_GWA2_43_14]|uniref:Glycosyltransferase RgtA/B/C/D-like domain-containing protein n=1 Tax=Candidatus Gottesmanbacteria bacterium GW2011_GWA2_43_14 TaxID=1618443 RepID=A0A0G1FRX3_9BACT|nr:MAG: hypothetical protein UV73_C0005G0053 [Candidatus Gottesmanbacteria bacterium GW2011_GWA2_43_14]
MDKSKQINLILFISAVAFTLFSMFPSFFELATREKLPPHRYFTLEHNYLFDYNFYLSRIRQGMEGKWLVTEKYFNRTHQESLFQIVYLYFGKLGGLFRLEPAAVYHLSRAVFGLALLLTTVKFGRRYLSGKYLLLFFLFATTSGSWPILVTSGGFYRFATYMGWWSVIDSLQRITIMPHILIGQLFLILFILKFSEPHKTGLKQIFLWGLLGNAAGIIFPPTLIICFAFFAVQSLMELLGSHKILLKPFIQKNLLPRFVFALTILPSLVYLQLMFKVMPWSALALFDIEHRMSIPYREYALALGPILPLGLAGLALVFIRGEKKYFPAVSWILAVALLFIVFENVPQQSPLRFTEGLIHVPLALLSVYFFLRLKGKVRPFLLKIASGAIVLTGLLVMVSMVLWLTDQGRAKRYGTWKVPIGAELVYPLDDFMKALFYLRENTGRDQVVLSFVTAGNYIPAYAGNYVYIGHANTPREDRKEIEVARFFKGEFGKDEAEGFIRREEISLVFYGPQEKAFGSFPDLAAVYPFLQKVYSNPEVILYRVPEK